MYYKLERRISPNYMTPAQAQAYYRSTRRFTEGAGHWWGLWQSNYSHDGVVNTFMNPARDGSANEVISDRRVTVMVEYPNVAITTQHANIFTKSYEVDPQIMHRWRSGASSAQKAKANRIFETVAQRMADTGDYTKPWSPHNKWWSTACNDIRWHEIVARAKQIVKERQAPPQAPEWKRNLKPINGVTLLIKRTGAPLRNLASVSQVIKTYTKGTPMEIAAETKVNGHRYLLTKYAYQNNTGQGFDEYELVAPEPPKPEWVRNLKDITDVKLFVLPAAGTPVYDLNTGKVKPDSVIPKGTAIDIAKKTTVGGKTYLITSYSVTHGLANGLLESAVGVPAAPPENEKPDWLDHLEDIKDVIMYTRAKVPVVNLLDGETVGWVEKNTKVAISAAIDWHGQKYFVTKWSHDSKTPNGISVNHLHDKPDTEPETPIEPAPEQPTLEDRVGIIEKIIEAIRAALAKIGIKI